MKGKHWTEDELAYLEYFVYENDAKLKEAAEFLGKSVGAIKNKLVRMRKKDVHVGYMQNRWTEKEEEFLRKNYKILLNKNIAKRLGRSVQSVQYRALQLGLKKCKSVKVHDEEIRKMLSEGAYLIDISKKLEINMGSLFSYCSRKKIHYVPKPREEIDNSNHPWRKMADDNYAEYLRKNKMEE